MKDSGKWAVAIAAGLGLLLATPLPAVSKPAFSKTAIQTAAAHSGKEEVRPCGQMAGKECPCDCGCPCCKKKSCHHCGHAHGKRKMPPMMKKMKGHLEEMRKAVSELRENEKTVEGAADIDALRKSVLLHLKKLDDLQESHLRHMESMMDARHGGKPDPPHMHSQ